MSIKLLSGVLLLLSCLCACTNNSKSITGYSSLTIVADSTFYLDTPSISAKYKLITPFLAPRYDTIYKELTYKFDSVENGDVTITLNSLVDTIYKKQIRLTKDTTIFFAANQIPSFETGDPLTMNFSDIGEGEKICISNGFSGCFSHGLRNLTIERKNNNYHVGYIAYPKWSTNYTPVHVKRVFDKSFADTLLDFQQTAINFLKSEKKYWCTTSESYHIRKGKTVYNFYDPSCRNEISFHKILRMIDPPSQ